MQNPPHPSGHVRENSLEPLDFTVTDGAKALGAHGDLRGARGFDPGEPGEPDGPG